MYQPIINSNARQKGDYLNNWRGVNRKEYAKENEFSAMSNLSSDRYPYISVRRRRIADNTLTSENGVVYTDGKYAGHIKYFGDDCIVNFNKNILHTSILYEDELCAMYYDYVHDKSGKMHGECINKKEVKVKGYVKNDPAYSLTFIDTSPSREWNEVFRVGDRIEISGTGNKWIDTIGIDVDSFYFDSNERKYLPVTCIVEEFEYLEDEEDDAGTEYCARMKVNFYNAGGERLREYEVFEETYEEVTVKKVVPHLADMCIYNNRVFGVDKKGKTIYASAPGSYSDWFRYEGLSTDSWYSEIGEDGEFTGIAECCGSIIAFKKDHIYKIYGDTAKNFTIQKISANGCIDKRSIVELNGRLYFLNYNGFCVYSGGYPTVISDVLGKTYTEAIGGTDGRKLYFYATASNGEKELVVYDTMLDMWHIEDSTDEVKGYFRYNGGAYFIGADDVVYKYDCDDYRDVDWSFTTTENNMLGMNYTKLSDMVIFSTTEVPDCQCQMKVEVIYDGESESVDCGNFLLVPGKTQRIPIRLRPCFAYTLKVSGTGPVIIKGIEKVFTAGGRNEGNRGIE